MEEKVLEILAGIDSSIPGFDGGSLFDAGLLDSFQVMELVETLEEAFDIEIDAEYVIAENFSTPQAIIDMMKKLVN